MINRVDTNYQTARKNGASKIYLLWRCIRSKRTVMHEHLRPEVSVKNEVDIIDQSLRAAASWCSKIYVFDNGSDDGTWETV